MLWLNPCDVSSFPDGLLDTLREETSYVPPHSTVRDQAAQLRQQMQANALRPVDDDEKPTVELPQFSEETVAEAAQFLSLTVSSIS